MTEDVVRAYYANGGEREWDRLRSPEGVIEFAVTTHTLTEYLPPHGRILDLGGGPGRYTHWLVERGYHVTLTDLSPELLAIARTKLATTIGTGHVEAIVEADARDLSAWSDQSFDAVVCLGPLYHLPAAPDREQAAREIVCVLRPHGVAFIAVMPPYTFLRRTIAIDDERPHLLQPDFITALMRDGAFINRIAGRFTAGSSMPPETIRRFFARYGLTPLIVRACDGIAVGLEAVIADVAKQDATLYHAILSLIIQTADDPSIHGICNHLVYVGCKET